MSILIYYGGMAIWIGIALYGASMMITAIINGDY